MTLAELAKQRKEYLNKYLPYKLTYWREFNYKYLDNILYRQKAGRGDNNTYNDVIIMADTETSKAKCNDFGFVNGQKKYITVENYVVAFTISLRAFNRNIVTLWGDNPRDMVKCIVKIIGNMNGFETFIYFHNLAYDWTFLRKFFFEEFGYPEKQLNTKSHYPIYIKFPNGLTLKDSLILAQRSLDKWSKDMNVEHQKAIGLWDYDKIRHQGEGNQFSNDELEYIEHDTLAGVECIDKLMEMLNKSIYSLPYTATGIPREQLRKRGADYHARDWFKKVCMSFDQYLIAEKVYHGGFTHANRHLIDVLIDELVECRDFSSSYPYCLLSEKYPMERFSNLSDKPYQYILDNAKEYAFMFKLTLIKPRLKDDFIPMPALQFSKCETSINAICDNGRILCADYIEIYLTELDLQVIIEQYKFDNHICSQVLVAKKGYLPRFITDYVFELYQAKCTLKNGDQVLYALKKAELNSIYGCHVQKPIKDNINEDYETGDYIPENNSPAELYEKYLNKRTSILPYQVGVWVTAYAFRNLFDLGKCVDYENGGQWVYSDTDSCYATKWNEERLNQYNEICKEKLKANGYGPVTYDGKEYWLGVAEKDSIYNQYKVMGAKRYCGRSVEDLELHITVAGVPKKTGAKCLDNDINKFTKGMIFDGLTTGKLTHSYNYVDKIYKNGYGDLIGDYIDLTPCDYLLDSVNVVDWESLFNEEIEVQVYE